MRKEAEELGVEGGVEEDEEVEEGKPRMECGEARVDESVAVAVEGAEGVVEAEGTVMKDGAGAKDDDESTRLPEGRTVEREPGIVELQGGQQGNEVNEEPDF